MAPESSFPGKPLVEALKEPGMWVWMRRAERAGRPA